MTRARELDLYLAVCACRDYLRRGVDPDLAASFAAAARGLPASEIAHLAVEAHRECERARRDRRFWQSPEGRAALKD